MRKSNPLFSPLGFTIALLIYSVLGWQFWLHGGDLFSPGPLTARAKPGITLGGVAAHNQIEACAACHQPLKTSQAQLCTACHTNVQLNTPDSSDLHRSISDETPCFACHSDHQGENFDPNTAARSLYDHSLANFSLIWHQLDYHAAIMTCDSCHTADQFQVSETACAECHTQADPVALTVHIQLYGNTCLACHDGADRMTRVDHQALALPLDGAHLEVECAACHVDGLYEGTPAACMNCHAEPAVHLGVFSDDCAACHSSGGWKPANFEGAAFDHAVQTRFSLARHAATSAGPPLICSDCHEQSLQTAALEKCIACHDQDTPAFMGAHIAQFGRQCLDCHDGIDRMTNFDHAAVFVLDGAHTNLECEGCHINQQYAGLPSDCVSCHEEPEIHAGAFGLKCQNCHTTQAWAPARLISHTFPLDHGDEGEIDCETCHQTTYVEYTCDACHDPGEMISKHNEENIREIAGRCLECHAAGLVEENEHEGND